MASTCGAYPLIVGLKAQIGRVSFGLTSHELCVRELHWWRPALLWVQGERPVSSRGADQFSTVTPGTAVRSL